MGDLFYVLAVLLAVGLLLGALPLLAYLVVKMATLGYLRGRQRFRELKRRNPHHHQGDWNDGSET